VAALRCGRPASVSCHERSYYYVYHKFHRGGVRGRLCWRWNGRIPFPGPCRQSGFRASSFGAQPRPRPVCSQSYIALNIRSGFSDRASIDMYDVTSETARQDSQAFILPLFAVEGTNFCGANPPGANKPEVIPSRNGTWRFRAWKVLTNERVFVPRRHRGCIEFLSTGHLVVFQTDFGRMSGRKGKLSGPRP